MALTRLAYTGDGSTVIHDITFNLGYINREHVYVYLDTDEYTTQISYTWLNETQIQLTAPVTSGLVYYIRRVLPRELVNDYQSGAILREKNLDDSFLQGLMIDEEVDDGFKSQAHTEQQDLRMGNHKIVELAEGVNDKDATNVLQVKTHNDTQDNRLNDLESTLTIGSLTYRRTTFTAVEGQTEFYPINATFSAIHSLFINGVHQIAGEAYELIGSTGFRTIALTEGDRVVAVIGEEPEFTTPIQVDLRYTRYSFFAVGGETSKVSPIAFEQVLAVYINGVHQTFGNAFDFTASTNTVNFASALSGGDEVVLVVGADPSELVGMSEETADGKYGLLIVPTSANGLPTGAIWNNGGTLTLV